MTEAKNNIRTIRLQRGLTLEQLAALTPHPKAGGVTDLTTIQKLETSKRKLTTDWLTRIAEALGVQPAALLASGIDYSPVRRVPLIGEIAAGNWREAIEDPVDLIPCTVGGPSTFALRPVGDSMDRMVPMGATIFVDPDDRELTDRKLYAMMRGDGETTFKQFRLNPPRFEPCSNNNAHRAIMVGEEPLTTLGRVVGQQSDL